MDFVKILNHILSSVYNNIPVNDLIYYIVLLYANKVNILPISKVLSKIIVSITLIKAFWWSWGVDCANPRNIIIPP